MTKIRIKFSGRIGPDQNPSYWLALFKEGQPIIDNCEFIFDPEETDYDWFVVYEDLMYFEGTNRSTRVETLTCPKSNTLLITQEPSAIKIYGPQFLGQYGHVLSAQPPAVVGHPNHILEVAPVRWFYGRPLEKTNRVYTPLDNFIARAPIAKTKEVSTVCSDKQMTPTLKQRFDFTAMLDKELGDKFDWFGRGVRPINEKSEAMDKYRYHVAIENHIFPHYWTEKIADSFLAYCLPFYYGPDNISDYFPEGSYIPIDINKPKEAVEIIKKTLSENTYEKHLPKIIEARNLVLERYNLVNVVARIVNDRHTENVASQIGHKIMGRHAFRKHHPIAATRDVLHRAKCRMKYGRN